MSNELIVTLQQENLVTVASNLNNPVYLESLDSVGDLDTSTNGKVNGSILVYRTTTNMWTSTTTLDAQNMEGGEF
jgi:hypothetical protein